MLKEKNYFVSICLLWQTNQNKINKKQLLISATRPENTYSIFEVLTQWQILSFVVVYIALLFSVCVLLFEFLRLFFLPLFFALPLTIHQTVFKSRKKCMFIHWLELTAPYKCVFTRWRCKFPEKHTLHLQNIRQ